MVQLGWIFSQPYSVNIIVENVISPLSLSPSHTHACIHTAGGDLWAQVFITEYRIISLFIEMWLLILICVGIKVAH